MESGDALYQFILDVIVENHSMFPFFIKNAELMSIIHSSLPEEEKKETIRAIMLTYSGYEKWELLFRNRVILFDLLVKEYTFAKIFKAFGFVGKALVGNKEYLRTYFLRNRFTPNFLNTLFVDAKRSVLKPRGELLKISHQTLKNYLTDREFLNLHMIYKPFFDKTSFNILRDRLDEIKDNEFMQFPRYPYSAANKDEDHLIMFEDRQDYDPKAEKDPYVSFMVDTKNYVYNTYFASELEGSIIIEDDAVTFNNPTPESGPLEFSLEQMENLHRHLRRYVVNYRNIEYQTLLNKVSLGIEKYQVVMKTQGVKVYSKAFEALKKEQKDLVLEYFSALFLLGLSLRFWQGPEHPYQWRSEYSVDNKKDHVLREELMVQAIDYLQLRHQKVSHFLNQLKDVRINFKKPADYSLNQKRSIQDIMDKLTKGDFCLLDAGDRFMYAGVFYFFLFSFYSDYNRMNEINLNYKEFSTALNQVRNEVFKKKFKDYLFDHTNFRGSGHIDPGARDKFE